MKARLSLTLSVTLAFAMTACGGDQASDAAVGEFATPAAGEIPTTTSSEEALSHFNQGQEAVDVGRVQDANEHFEMAVEADPTCAICYLNVANTAASLDEFKTNLDEAAQRAANASEGERLMIEIAQRGFANDPEGQLRLATELVAKHPNSARALVTLAGIQSGLTDHATARSTFTRAAELNSEFAPAYTQLGLSYLFQDPIDLARAHEYMQMVVDLVPEEGPAWDNLGDTYRAQGRLEEARDSYNRAAELDPENGLPLQQRGHVNSILGNYEEARADYDAAIALSEDAQISSFAVYRSYTHAHAGEAQAAIDELNGIVEKIDGEEWGIREDQRTGQKIFALTSLAAIALHHDLTQAAEAAIEQFSVLMRRQAEGIGTPEFTRGQESTIAYWEGVLAARKGDFETATMKAEEFAQIVEPDANPRKMELAHDLLGLTARLQGNCAEAVTHFGQANLTVPYTKYQMAVAQECAGNTEEAMKLYREISEYNFNAVGFALVKEEAKAKLSP